MNKMIFKNLYEKIISLLYPNNCPYCQKIISGDSFCCALCRERIKNETDIRFIFSINENKSCYCISPLKYNGLVRKAVMRFKFNGFKSYVKEFAERTVFEINKNFGDLKFDYVTAVPLSSKRKISRGYNQAEWLACEISDMLGVEFKNLLLKNKDNFPQHELNFQDRSENVKGVYGILSKCSIKNKTILLCDDIITTGNTLKECARILYKNGAKNVLCCTIAYVQVS